MMGITYGDHLIDSGYHDITPEQEREIEAREECARRGLDPDEICADGGVTAWMVVDRNGTRSARPDAWQWRFKSESGEWSDWNDGKARDWVVNGDKEYQERPLYAALPDLEARLAKALEALAFYANPVVYKPHPHGLAFDQRDLSFLAKSVLEGQ